MMISLKKAFADFSKHPFIFIWPSLVYLAFQFLFILAAVGLFLVFFLLASVLNLSTDIQEIPMMAAMGVVVIIFLFFSCGLNAGLAKGYFNALDNRKTTAKEFFKYSLEKSAIMFVIMLLRDLVYLFITGPVVGLYLYFLTEYQYVDILVILYVLFATFAVHLLFTPAFISAGALGTSLFQSMRNGFYLIRKKHIMFVGLYAVFGILWVLNLIPFIQLVTIFALYPIVYSAAIIMVKENIR